MKFKAGDEVWAEIHRPELGANGKYEATVVQPNPVQTGNYSGTYIINVPKAPCPIDVPGYPKWSWVSHENTMTLRNPPEPSMDIASPPPKPVIAPTAAPVTGKKIKHEIEAIKYNL